MRTHSRNPFLALLACVAACDSASHLQSHPRLDGGAGEDMSVDVWVGDGEVDAMDAHVAPDAETNVGLDAGADADLDDAEADDADLDATNPEEADASDADAGESDAAAAELDASVAYPRLLSETGLYLDLASGVLAPGVEAFEPRYKLWSDGATKRRWVFLPESSVIDSSDMDRWIYPVGTKLWKEFAVAGKPVETRLLEKQASGEWTMVSYQWRADLTDALAVPGGVENANGTQHDIPSTSLCVRCHGSMADGVLGFSAIQLSHSLGGLNIDALLAEGRLSDAPAEPCVLPGAEEARAALGYLHANCGHCHNPWSQVFATLKQRSPFTGGPELWERTNALGQVTATVGYLSTVGRPNAILPSLHIIEPGQSAKSELVVRMGQRGVASLQMPPIGSEVVDSAGLTAVRTWIDSLPLADDAGALGE